MNKLNIGLEKVFESSKATAKRLGVTEQAIRKAIKEGRLMASRIGHQWIIPKDAVIKKGVGR